MSDDWKTYRAKVAALTRSRPADDPELVEAQAQLRYLRAEEVIRKIVDAAPPLTREQRWKLSVLMKPPSEFRQLPDLSKYTGSTSQVIEGVLHNVATS